MKAIVGVDIFLISSRLDLRFDLGFCNNCSVTLRLWYKAISSWLMHSIPAATGSRLRCWGIKRLHYDHLRIEDVPVPLTGQLVADPLWWLLCYLLAFRASTRARPTAGAIEIPSTCCSFTLSLDAPTLPRQTRNWQVY
jgi:hypothetical protein